MRREGEGEGGEGEDESEGEGEGEAGGRGCVAGAWICFTATNWPLGRCVAFLTWSGVALRGGSKA